MNGNEINTAINRPEKGSVALAYSRNKGNPTRVINDLYLSALGRPAKPAEIANITRKMVMRVKDKDQMAPYQDLFWALLNSNEFMLNH
jgi:hypothetical protein